MSPEGDFVPLPAVVARLAARSSLPPPRKAARAKPALEQSDFRQAPRMTQAQKPDVILYTDGACAGNPGPGGWAAIIIDGGEERTALGAEPRTTNQRMELMAAIEGLAAIGRYRRVQLYTDSAY